MAFFEDIALLVNTNLLRREVAYYMFGCDAMTAWDSDVFWSQELREMKDWTFSKTSSGQMKQRIRDPGTAGGISRCK